MSKKMIVDNPLIGRYYGPPAADFNLPVGKGYIDVSTFES
jgi:hypothetical protein